MHTTTVPAQPLLQRGNRSYPFPGARTVSCFGAGERRLSARPPRSYYGDIGNLVAQSGAFVLIAMNYRLGTFGFLPASALNATG